MDKVVNYPMRLFFKKEGRACYISHLDLSRALSRALVRSGLPCWYTMGFNPHLYRTFSLPLALGVEGKRESCDIKLNENLPLDYVKETINASLPEGIEVLEVKKPNMDPKEIMWADYSLILDCDGSECENAVNSLLEMEEILVDKKTKKGIKKQNIRELFYLLSIEKDERHAVVNVRCRAGVEINLNPDLILKALSIYEGFQPYFGRTVRNKILTEALEEFN